VQLHYERWACIKAFGKQQAKRVVGGNAVIPVKLTPGVTKIIRNCGWCRKWGRSKRTVSLGELLRSGTVGEMIRDKIRRAFCRRCRKGRTLARHWPPAARGYATIENAAFRDGGAGRLMVVLDGELRITKEQVQMLSKQVKERVAGR